MIRICYAVIAAASIALFVSGCAAPGSQSSAPSQFAATDSSTLLETEAEFVNNIAGKTLKLINDNISATVVFKEDGTAGGSLKRSGADTQVMVLNWVWENNSYCRTGTIGNSELERKCESIRLFPGVGVLFTYLDSDDPEEYWLFE